MKLASPFPAEPHESATAHVTGAARYTDELAMPAGALSMMPVLATCAHARIVVLDVCAARVAAGVVDVITAAEVPGHNNTGPIVHDEPLLPTDTVQFYGQALAWVVAQTQAQAQAAAALVRFELAPLPAILSFSDAKAAQAYHMAPKLLLRGDAEAALAHAAHRLKGVCASGAQDHFYLETQASWAVVDSENIVRVHASTQHPSETQHIVAHVLGRKLFEVVVNTVRMGGGFGGKETQANAFAALVALAAVRTGRAVRIKLKRELDMTLTGKRHPFRTEFEVGFDSNGRIEALRAEITADAGWSLDLTPPVLTRAMAHLDNAYYLPHVHITGLMARTNKVSNTAFRGFGGPQGMLVIEEIISHIARRLGLPPDVVRAHNFYCDGREVTHYLQPVRDAGGELRMQRLWAKALAQGNFHARKSAVVAFNAANSATKRGLAITPVKFGISFNKVQYNQAGAHVLIYQDGSVQVNHGGTEMGQGLHSKMLAVAARSLGVAREHIKVMVTSTEKVPNTSATAASAGADLNGQAVKSACEAILARIIEVLRSHWQLPATSAIVSEKDRISADTERSMPFADAVALSYDARVSLAATGYYATPGLSWDMASNTGQPFYYFSYGAAVSEVEIDGYTGEWRLRSAHLVHDVGNSLNPLIDIGQIEGGFVQGMGWLTMEELVWDAAGRLRTVAPSTYKIPTISEVPCAASANFSTTLLDNAAQPGVIYASKAAGEPPFMLAISVREAMRDAVAAFGDSTQRDPVQLACPSTPEAILAAVERMRQASVLPRQHEAL
jgi:xanthine dehydrogenase large subunit